MNARLMTTIPAADEAPVMAGADLDDESRIHRMTKLGS